ncbi:BlaI/MecI/CopY family transcriptional regulator [Pseudoalteromonas sp. T1lg24]|uniref:BlaI/MecI/CopY family transcriptional regulator n=1 Tax=Pseudoalteromonas sp. T1lg24 TaxID=2077099 RepID=UPI000CF74D31|nr:BlaI/MecI/CopY family transcriptional regulator [Pseudoalteromonas sp. T1lg24]
MLVLITRVIFMDISNSEFEVLQALWRVHPADAQTVVDELNKEKDWHEKTVKTLLGRMVKKGAINFEKNGRSYIYSPVLEIEAYQVQESESLIERLFNGRIAPLVTGFAKNKNLSKQDIDELKHLIDKWEKNND